jgi:plastocyanin
MKDRRWQLVIILVIAAIIVVGAFVLTRNSNNSYNSTSTSTTTQPTTNQSSDSSSRNNQNVPSSQNTITYDGNNFSPSTLTVKSGSTVTVKNMSSDDLQFDSGPHPTHTSNPELNIGLIAAGESKTFTVTKTGTFDYHNHLNPSQTGTIIVEGVRPL